jgi:hypothetical protein
LKKPEVRLKGPISAVHEWHRMNPEAIEKARAERPEAQSERMEAAMRIMRDRGFDVGQKLSAAYDSAVRVADMQQARASGNFDWDGAYTRSLLEIIEAAPGREKYRLLRRVFEDHLKEGKAHVE